MSHPSSAARPKRGGEDFARQYENTSKKPRFDHRNPSTLAADAPEDDPVLDADVIGKAGAQTKRNAVNIDGYESDSDNDNFNERAAERERRQKAGGGGKAQDEDDDDDDMFADLEEDVQGTRDGDEDEDLAREGKARKKEVRFMRPEEIIEGQVMSSTSGGRVSVPLGREGKGKGIAGDRDGEGSESSSGDEEEQDRLPEEMEEELAAEIGAGGKKKHAPKLDAFNLKQEEEEGQYDESGNYVRKATDPDAVNDSWLDGLSKKDMKRAKEAQEKREEEKRRRRMEADATLTSDLLGSLISHLETGETPLEALQRLKKHEKKDKKVPKWKQKRQEKNHMDVDGGVETAANAHSNGTVDPAERIRKEAVEAITGAADALYSREQLDIYETERELLLRQYKRETGEDWQPPATQQKAEDEHAASGANATFEYRWSDKRDGGQLHGPYDGETMKAWNGAGYFGEGVEFRRVGSGEWSRLLDVS